jgi:hypothetical protein
MRYVSKKPKTQLCPRCREPVDSGHCACCHVVLTYAEMVSHRVCPSCRELHAFEVGSRPIGSLTHPQSEPMPNQL